MARGISIPISFQLQGLRNLVHARSAVNGFGRQTYGALNQAMRGSTALDKSFGKLGRTLAALGTGVGIAMLAKKFIDSTAELQTNTIIFETMMGDAKKADDTIRKLRMTALDIGSDQAEMIKSARGIYGSALQVDPNVTSDQINNLTKVAGVLSMLDTENRGVSFAAFSIKEMLQGTGQADWRSLRDRLEINLGDATEKAITKAVQAKNLQKAIDLFNEGLKRIHIDPDNMIEALKKKGFQLNVTRLFGMITLAAQQVLAPAFEPLTAMLAKANNALMKMMQSGSAGFDMLERKGRFLKEMVLEPFVRTLEMIGQRFSTLSDHGDSMRILKVYFFGIQHILDGMVVALTEFTVGFLGFGDDFNKNLGRAYNFSAAMEQWASWIKKNRVHIKKFGEDVRKVLNSVIDILDHWKLIAGVIAGIAIAAIAVNFTLGILSAVAAVVLLKKTIASVGIRGSMGGLFGGSVRGGITTAVNKLPKEKQTKIPTSSGGKLPWTPFKSGKQAGFVPRPGLTELKGKFQEFHDPKPADWRGGWKDVDPKDIKPGATTRFKHTSTSSGRGVSGAEALARRINEIEVKIRNIPKSIMNFFGKIGNAIMDFKPSEVLNKIKSFFGKFKNIWSMLSKGVQFVAKSIGISGLFIMIDSWTGEARTLWGKIGQQIAIWVGGIGTILGLIGVIVLFFVPGGQIPAVLIALGSLGVTIGAIGAGISLASKLFGDGWRGFLSHMNGLISGLRDLTKIPIPTIPIPLPSDDTRHYQRNHLSGGPQQNANGGKHAGGWTMVGERGPEPALLPSGTQVMSNKNMMAINGPPRARHEITIHNNINVKGNMSDNQTELLAARVSNDLTKQFTSIFGNGNIV